MASRRAITKAQAVRYRSGVEDGEVGVLGCGVRGDRIQSGLCPQGAEGGGDAPGGEAPDPETAEVRREGCSGTGEVLGGG